MIIIHIEQEKSCMVIDEFIILTHKFIFSGSLTTNIKISFDNQFSKIS